MNILLTGGAGFIGSHIAERLLSEGHSVVCLDNFDDFYDPSIKRENIRLALASSAYRLVEGDIRNATDLDRCMAGGGIDVVVHMAARAGVRPSLLQPHLYYDVNTTGTLEVLEAMRRHGVRRLVMASSSSVYGNAPKTPFSEHDPVDTPISPYAASKKACELLAYTYHHLYGFDIFCLRLFTVYGPRQRPEMAIHQFVRKIIAGDPIVMYGDGSTRRDYTYVEDIVDGIVASVHRVNGYEILNLGESRTITLAELVSAIEAATGIRAKIVREPMQPGDVLVTYADVAKARRILGYSPQFTVQEGVRRFVDWYRGKGKV